MNGEWFVLMGHLRRRQRAPVMMTAYFCNGTKVKRSGCTEFRFNSYEHAHRFYCVVRFFCENVRQPCLYPY